MKNEGDGKTNDPKFFIAYYMQKLKKKCYTVLHKDLQPTDGK